MTSQLYVLGHKNSDIDSLATAIAVAHLLRELRSRQNLEPHWQFLTSTGGRIVAGINGVVGVDMHFVLERYGIVEGKDFEVLDHFEGDNVVLVDHNSSEDFIDGIRLEHVRLVLDHHKRKLPDSEATPVMLYKTGSLSTAIANLYRQENILIPLRLVGLLLAGILSDTKLLWSTTTVTLDREIAKWLAAVTGEDIEVLGTALFAVLDKELFQLSALEVLTRDVKVPEEQGYAFHISSVQTFDLARFAKRIPELLEEMYRIVQEETHMLLILDMQNPDRSMLLVTKGYEEYIEYALGSKCLWAQQPSGGILLMLNGITSRKQIMAILPKIIENMKADQ